MELGLLEKDAGFDASKKVLGATYSAGVSASVSGNNKGAHSTTSATDSLETGLWEFVKKDTPLVLFGNFSDGLPINKWQFVLNNGRRFQSNWNVYKINITGCSFSLPFKYEETIFDSTKFKVTTNNDSLGKISIIVGVSKSKLGNEQLLHFNSEVEAALPQYGFKFMPRRIEVKNSKAAYVFTEFFMKDSQGQGLNYTIFNYAIDNPLRFIDPDGRKL